MVIVVALFLASIICAFWHVHHDPVFFARPSCEPQTFHPASIFAGTSVAVLTYIGFDAVSTLSEEAENPRRNILMATVLVCLITGLLSGHEVYAAQLVWGSKPFPRNTVESAFALISRQVGGVILFQVINFTLLLANMGSGMGSQFAARRLLYGTGCGDGRNLRPLRSRYTGIRLQLSEGSFFQYCSIGRNCPTESAESGNEANSISIGSSVLVCKKTKVYSVCHCLQSGSVWV
jgi:hypothetical protein